MYNHVWTSIVLGFLQGTTGCPKLHTGRGSLGNSSQRTGCRMILGGGQQHLHWPAIAHSDQQRAGVQALEFLISKLVPSGCSWGFLQPETADRAGSAEGPGKNRQVAKERCHFPPHRGHNGVAKSTTSPSTRGLYSTWFRTQKLIIYGFAYLWKCRQVPT